MKRKASDLEDNISWASWSPSSDSTLSWNDSPGRKTVAPVPWSFANDQRKADNHINLRTRKRARDNRPDIQTIHENTLARLFQAQRQQNDATISPPSSHQTSPAYVSHNDSEPAQRNLHAFFNIGQQPTKTERALSFQQTAAPSPVCDDCGNQFSCTSVTMHDMMELDSGSEFTNEDFRCFSCERKVCDMCAVRGDHRLCLECALPGGG